MHLLLNYENDYTAKIISARFVEGKGHTGKGVRLRGARYRALNHELEIFDPDGTSLGILSYGFSVENMESHNSPFMRFIRSLGLFCDPNCFDPKELEGLEIRVVINNVCDSHFGLRSVVSRIFPARKAA